MSEIISFLHPVAPLRWNLSLHPQLPSHDRRRQVRVANKRRRSSRKQLHIGIRAEISEASPSSSAKPPPPSIPTSFIASCSEAISCSQAALAEGLRYLFIELDTTAGDPTYSLLKNTLPVAKAIAEANWDGFGELKVVMPDFGSAAMVRRDWGEVGSVVASEQDVTDRDVCVLVAPAAREVEMMRRLVQKNSALIVVNADLVDMGVTGLSLNARKLRTEVVDLFETSFWLKTYEWGLLLRKWPGRWSLWVDDKNEESGFRMIKMMENKPSNEEIEKAIDLQSATGRSGNVGLLTRLKRFLSLYSKG